MGNKSTTFIYAIQSINFKFIKIGISNDVEQRLRALQTANPDELQIIACWPGDIRHEQAMHRRLQSARAFGEWFNPLPEVLAAIKEQNKAVAGSKPGQLKIVDASGQAVEFWSNTRSAAAPEIIHGELAAYTIVSQAEYLSQTLSPHYAAMAKRIAFHGKTLAEDIGKLKNKKPTKSAGVLSCSFCGKSQTEIEKLIAGPDIYVCNECVGICDEILEQDKYGEGARRYSQGDVNALVELVKIGQQELKTHQEWGENLLTTHNSLVGRYNEIIGALKGQHERQLNRQAAERWLTWVGYPLFIFAIIYATFLGTSAYWGKIPMSRPNPVPALSGPKGEAK